MGPKLRHLQDKGSKICIAEWPGNLRLAVAIRFGHGITIRSAILAIVCTIRGIPRLIIHGTVETLWYSVLSKNVGIEKHLEVVSCQRPSTGAERDTHDMKLPSAAGC